jgi:hypothetical protein
MVRLLTETVTNGDGWGEIVKIRARDQNMLVYWDPQSLIKTNEYLVFEGVILCSRSLSKQLQMR